MSFMKEGYLLASIFKDTTMFTRIVRAEFTPYNPFPVSSTAIPASGSLNDVELILSEHKLLTIDNVEDPISILDVQFGIPSGIRMFRHYPSSEPLRGNPYNFPTPTVNSDYGYWDSTTSPFATPTEESEMYFYPIIMSRFSFKNTTTAAITLTLNMQINQCYGKLLSPNNEEDMRFIRETIHEWYKNPTSQIFRIDKVGGNTFEAGMPIKLKEVVENISLQDVL